MLALALTTLLAILGVAAFPCWRHSARWGHGPAVSVGMLMLLVAVVSAGGRTSATQALVKPVGAPIRVSPDEVRMANLLGAEAISLIPQ
jgi:hypothetical protein